MKFCLGPSRDIKMEDGTPLNTEGEQIYVDRDSCHLFAGECWLEEEHTRLELIFQPGQSGQDDGLIIDVERNQVFFEDGKFYRRYIRFFSVDRQRYLQNGETEVPILDRSGLGFRVDKLTNNNLFNNAGKLIECHNATGPISLDGRNLQVQGREVVYDAEKNYFLARSNSSNTVITANIADNDSAANANLSIFAQPVRAAISPGSRSPIPLRAKAVAQRRSGMQVTRQRSDLPVEIQNPGPLDAYFDPPRLPRKTYRYDQQRPDRSLVAAGTWANKPKRSKLVQWWTGRQWLFHFGAGICFASLLLVLLFGATGWVSAKWEDLRYGLPRTFQTDQVVGHGNSPNKPCHFVALNLQGSIEVIEIPSGDLQHAKIYQGPTLSKNSALEPVTLEFRDVNGDGSPDMIIDVEEFREVFINDPSQNDFRQPNSNDKMSI